MSFKVHNTQSYLTDEAAAYLADNDCEIVGFCNWVEYPEPEQLVCRDISGIDAVVAGGEPYTNKVFDAADRLKIVARTGAGYDAIDLDAATAHGVWVTNTPDATSPAVADFSLSLILCLLRKTHIMAQDMKQGVWRKICGRELGGLTLGIVGTGSIGKEVIRRASGFNASILAYDVEPDQTFASELQFDYVPLDDLVSRSDIVSLHVPLSKETTGLIDRRRLGMMRNTAYIVNTSRAPVIDREALLEALNSGAIAGAALDVHDPAPCKPDDPLVLHENVLATPWCAYNTEEAIARICMSAARDIVTVLHGGTPAYPLNCIVGPAGA